MLDAGDEVVESSIYKRSIVVAGRKTSISLEDAFWHDLREIAQARQMTLSQLVAVVDATRRQGNLSSAIRQFILGVYRDQRSDGGRLNVPSRSA